MAKTLRCYLGKHEWRLRKGRLRESDEEVASPLVVYEPVELVSAAGVEREP